MAASSSTDKTDEKAPEEEAGGTTTVDSPEETVAPKSAKDEPEVRGYNIPPGGVQHLPKSAKK